MDEKEAIAACQSGELTHFALVYDRYNERIYKYVNYRVRHKETVEDIVSTIFIKAMEGIGSYDAGKGPFAAWIYRIARNATIDHYRKHVPTDDIEAHGDFADDTDIEADLIRNEDRDVVNKHLKKLTPAQQELIKLRIWDELPFAEIAVILEKTEAGCKMAFYRSLKALGELMSAILLAILGVVHAFLA